MTRHGPLTILPTAIALRDTRTFAPVIIHIETTASKPSSACPLRLESEDVILSRTSTQVRPARQSPIPKLHPNPKSP